MLAPETQRHFDIANQITKLARDGQPFFIQNFISGSGLIDHQEWMYWNAFREAQIFRAALNKIADLPFDEDGDNDDAEEYLYRAINIARDAQSALHVRKGMEINIERSMQDICNSITKTLNRMTAQEAQIAEGFKQLRQQWESNHA